MKHHPIVKCAKQGLLISALAVGFGLSAEPLYAATGLNPDADEILRSMSNFLTGTQSFSFNADIANEIVNLEGQKLQFNSHATMLIDRPSRFHVHRKGRFVDTDMYYDGAKITIYGHNLNAFIQKEIAGTIDDAIVGIESESGFSAPGADLIMSNPYSALSSGAVSSGYYGTAYVGGIECHHLSFRSAKVDLQLWVKVGDEPLPMKYVITSKWITGAPQYSVQLSNWNLKPQISADQFEFLPPDDAQKIEGLTVDEAGEITLPEGDK